VDEDDLVDVNARRETLPEAVEDRHDDTDTDVVVVVRTVSVDVRATASMATPPPRRIDPASRSNPVLFLPFLPPSRSRSVGSGRVVATFLSS